MYFSNGRTLRSLLGTGRASVREFRRTICVRLSKGPRFGAVFAYDRRTSRVLLCKPFNVWVYNYLPFAVREDFIVSFLRRLKRPDGRGESGARVKDVTFENNYPALFEYVTSPVHADKKPRKTSSFTVFQDGGVLKAFFNEKDSGASFCVSSDTLAGLLAALEGILSSNDPPWRWNDNDGGRSKKKVRRGG